MTTATIDEPRLSRPETKSLFMSRRAELRLVRVQQYPIYGPGGRQVGIAPGETHEFRDGVFRTDDPDVIAWLLGDAERGIPPHHLLGDREEGFWPVDPVAPPVSQDELDAVLSAVTSFDEEQLSALVEQERTGWARPALLAPAEKALAKVRELTAAAIEAEQAKAAE